MHNLKAIRHWLGVTQQEIGGGIGCTQGNVGHYERGQMLPPEMARKLIGFAASRGRAISFDHVYGVAELPVVHQLDVPETTVGIAATSWARHRATP